MIERKFIKEKLNDYKIQEFLQKNFERSSYSHAIIQKTPLGDKIVIFSSRPGMIVGKGGENLRKLTQDLKELKIQNPQIDVQEIDNAMIDASIVTEKIVEMFLKMGTGRFKFIGHNMCEKVLGAGAIGVQITLAGRIPAARAKMWKFIGGFLPKCGSIAYTQVNENFKVANLKTGAIGVRVKILPPNIRMPDEVIVLGETIQEKKAESIPEIEKSIINEIKDETESKKEKKSEEKPKAEKEKKSEPEKEKLKKAGKKSAKKEDELKK